MIRSLRWMLCAAIPVLASACSIPDVSGNGYRVEWFDGLGLLPPGESGSALATSEDIRQALTAPREFPFLVATTGGEKISLGACNDYLQVKQTRVRPVSAIDWAPFMGWALSCRAARMVLSAGPSTTSHVHELAFDASLPERLPWQVAMIISVSERERIAASRPDATWKEALLEPLTEFSSCGEHCGVYGDASGQQAVKLVARGDFNDDRIEDVLIRSFDSVKGGGSYRASRMFLITRRSADGDYELLETVDY